MKTVPYRVDSTKKLKKSICIIYMRNGTLKWFFVTLLWSLSKKKSYTASRIAIKQHYGDARLPKTNSNLVRALSNKIVINNWMFMN